MLSAGGLAPSSTFRDVPQMSSGQSTHDWNRLWIVVQQVDVKTVNEGQTKYVEIGDIQMKVEARQMEKNAKGELVDRKVQDQNAASYKFAAKFTQLYEQIAQVYPIFTRLKSLSKAIALA